ncbi:MAG: histidine phosphatase family protein [Gemmataceae bacterium]|nr:histidine phosphatase family protein [Gemmataceae bacterium]
MPQVVVILPGATDYELQGRIHGDLDIPLCPEGREEVGRVGRELQDLGIEVLYTSCCSSAAETAQAIGKALGVKVKKLEQLENLDHGLWQGLLIDEVRQKQPKVYRQWLEQPETICPPEGETIEHARQRVQGVLAKLLKKHADGVIGLVIPEPLASVVRAELGTGDLGDLWRANCEHGCWSVLSVGKSGKGELAAAATMPLPAPATPLNGRPSENGRNGDTPHHHPAGRDPEHRALRQRQEEAAVGLHAGDSRAPLPAQIFP